MQRDTVLISVMVVCKPGTIVIILDCPNLTAGVDYFVIPIPKCHSRNFI